MDSETTRAILCARIWAGLTSAERAKLKTPAALLPAVDDLMKRSIGMGSPYEDGVARVLLDSTPLGAPLAAGLMLVVNWVVRWQSENKGDWLIWAYAKRQAGMAIAMPMAALGAGWIIRHWWMT